MTEAVQVDPIETTKDTELIKGTFIQIFKIIYDFLIKHIAETKEEISEVDVFVCGKCHEVFHYVENFQNHKDDGVCTGVSKLREENKNNTEQKTQVWGFLLWKNAKFKKDDCKDSKPTSWSIYQSWCNLDISEKDSWIAAGQTILASYKIGMAKMHETASIGCQVR